MRGRVYCGSCGTLMWVDANAKKMQSGNRRPRYRCRGSFPSQHQYRQDATLCTGRTSLPISELDEQVWTAIADVLRNGDTVLAEIRRRLDGPDRISAWPSESGWRTLGRPSIARAD